MTKILSPFDLQGKLDVEKMTWTDVAFVLGLLAVSTWIMISLLTFLLTHAASIVTLIVGVLIGRWWGMREGGSS